MRILIVEDELKIAQYLERRIVEYYAHEEVQISRSASMADALELMEKKPIDLLVLDLNLGGKDGFEILKTMVSNSFHTIVVSAYKERAIEAFELGVLDFVPKPFSAERLHQALQRLTDKQNKQLHPVKYFAVKKKGRIVMVSSEDVLYIEAYGHYSKLHLKDNKREVYDKSLSTLTPLLGQEYERIHKSYIVRIVHMKTIHVYEGGKYSLELHNGTTIPVGRSKYKTLKEKWFT